MAAQEHEHDDPKGWWSIVTSGSQYGGPCGPWKNKEKAEDALDGWRERTGSEAGTIEAASNLRVVGPFPSRQVARDADISDYTNYLVGARPRR